MDEIKPLALDNYEFGWEEITMITAFCGILGKSRFSLVYRKIKNFQFDESSGDRKLSLITLMEWIKPAILEKQDFKNPDLPNLKAIL